MNRDEVFTVKEVASLLRVGDRTIYSMASAGDLPGFKVRGQWRFRKRDIETWIEDQMKTKQMAGGEI